MCTNALRKRFFVSRSSRTQVIASAKPKKKVMKVAVNGCSHGDLDRIYATLAAMERQQGIKIDLLLCCGDFQAVRNVDDLLCFACPPKYRALKDFHKYYSGEKRAPIPTLFVGGNHEAVNHLWELYYGGWAAPNIRYLGHAGVINFGGLRIAGLSGIFKSHHYQAGHFEQPPYTDSTMRSAYHVRELEVYRLLKVKGGVDVFMSHDWPTHVPRYGNSAQLVRCKPAFRKEVETDSLGSPANWQLLQALKPAHWFAGHLHVWFSAAVPHGARGAALPPGDASATRVTKFCALDKPLPKRRFLQVVDIPVAKPGPMEFSYDAEWLAILRETHDLMSLSRAPSQLPTPLAAAPPAAREATAFVTAALARAGARVPNDFAATVDTRKRGQGAPPRSIPRNAQTEALLALIGRPWNLGGGSGGPGGAHTAPVANAEEIDIDGSDDEVDEDADGQQGASDDPLFAAVEIHNYDPHGVSDARDALNVNGPGFDANPAPRQRKASKLSDALRFVPRQVVHKDPAEIDLQGEDDDSVAAMDGDGGGRDDAAAAAVPSALPCSDPADAAGHADAAVDALQSGQQQALADQSRLEHGDHAPAT